MKRPSKFASIGCDFKANPTLLHPKWVSMSASDQLTCLAWARQNDAHQGADWHLLHTPALYSECRFYGTWLHSFPKPEVVAKVFESMSDPYVAWATFWCNSACLEKADLLAEKERVDFLNEWWAHPVSQRIIKEMPDEHQKRLCKVLRETIRVIDGDPDPYPLSWTVVEGAIRHLLEHDQPEFLRVARMCAEAIRHTITNQGFVTEEQWTMVQRVEQSYTDRLRTSRSSVDLPTLLGDFEIWGDLQQTFVARRTQDAIDQALATRSHPIHKPKVM